MDENKKYSEDDPLLKFKDIRSEDVKSISDLIKKIRINRIRHSINYYPFRFFADGVEAYKYFFDNAVIFYTATAVEIGLLIKLKTLVEEKRQTKPEFKPDFKWLTGHSKSLLSKDLRAGAEQVRIMRNCYVHYQNIVAHTAWMDQVDWPDTVKRTKSEYKDDRNITETIELLSKLADEQREKSGMLTIRFDFLELNEEIMPFIKSRYEAYLRWLPEFWSAKKKVIRIEDFCQIYGIEAFDSLSCITWSFEILKELNYLREGQ